MPEAGFIWTDGHVSTLRRMWASGASSGLISRTLGGGVTRNAVMGKVNRLGLMGAGGRSGPPLGQAVPPRIETAMPPLPHAAKPALPVAPPPPVAAAPAPAQPRLSVRDLVAAALAGSHPATRTTQAAPVATPPVRAAAKPKVAAEQAKPRGPAAKAAMPAKAVTPPKAAPIQAPEPEPVAAPEPDEAPAPAPILSLFSWEVPREDGRPTLLGLKAESCRWPIGDPGKPDFHFCGEAASEPRPYCTAHCAAAYQVRDPNRPKVVWSPMRVAQARQATLARLRLGPQRGRSRASA